MILQNLKIGVRVCLSVGGNPGCFLYTRSLSSYVIKKPLNPFYLAKMTQPQFYRRILPDTCIAFASPEGKRLFAEALSSGQMECYFKLASQFRTQDEPAYCGLTSLVMVLNALEIDPGQVWKGPWRWYHETMLECCAPVDIMKEQGVTFDQFTCIALCNSVQVKAVRIPESPKLTTPELEAEDNTLLSQQDHTANSFPVPTTKSPWIGTSLDDFRQEVKYLTSVDDEFLVLSYSRKVLGQTGDGHFSPIGGYHSQSDMVLVMDTARFKYPPHWVPLKLIWEAMKPIDKSTGKSRGYFRMKKSATHRSLPLFKLSSSFSLTVPCGCSGSVTDFITKWSKFLQKSLDTVLTEGSESESDGSTQTSSKNLEKSLNLSRPDSRQQLLHVGLCQLMRAATNLSTGDCVITTFFDMKCLKESMQTEQMLKLKSLVCFLEKMEIYQIVVDFLKHCSEKNSFQVACLKSIGRTCENQATQCCALDSGSDIHISPAHFISVLLLCWPYLANKTNRYPTSFGSYLNKCLEFSKVDLKKSPELKTELSALEQQLTLVLQIFEEQQCDKM